MIPALSQVCSLHTPFGEDLDDYAAGKCQVVEIWWTKLEQFLASHSCEAVKERLEACGMVAPVASYQGGLLVTDRLRRDEAWRLLGTRLDLCRQLAIGTMVVACDLAGPIRQAEIDAAQQSLGQLASLAGDHGVRVALEFQARSALGNNLETAVAMVEHVDSPHLGLCLDSFHFHIGPSKEIDLSLLHRDNLFHVQLSDLSGVAREMATDSDRILPGDGEIVWEPIVARLRAIDYRGCISVETMNPRLWQVPSRQFGEIAITALRRLLGLAEPG